MLEKGRKKKIERVYRSSDNNSLIVYRIFLATYHFVINFMEVDLAYFVYDILALKSHEAEP